MLKRKKKTKLDEENEKFEANNKPYYEAKTPIYLEELDDTPPQYDLKKNSRKI